MTTLTDKYINPFTDFGFKRIFGEEPNKDILIDFLNTLFLGELVIKELSLNPPYKTSKTKEERKAIFDLYCTTTDGERIIIEMQKAKQKYFKDRSVFYSTFPIQEQAQTGEWDFQLNAVYTIGILDFVFDDQDKNKQIVHEVKLIDTKTSKVFYDKLTFMYLQMPNFNKQEHELETRFDQWLYALKNLSKFQKYPNILNDKIFKKLFKISEIANFSKEELLAYEDSLKTFRDLKNTLDTARDEGLATGLAKGRQEGEQIGIAKGECLPILKALRKGKSTKEVADFNDIEISFVEKLKALLDKYADDTENHLAEIY